MDKVDLEVIEYLFLEKTAYEAIMSYIDIVIFPNKPSNEYEEFQQSLVRYIYKENLDIVFKFAESPIEKIFLNALLLQNLMYRSYLIKYTEPLSPINQVINNARANFVLTMQMWQRFQDLYEKDEIGGKFVAFIANSPELTTEDKSLIIHHLIYEWYDPIKRWKKKEDLKNQASRGML